MDCSWGTFVHSKIWDVSEACNALLEMSRAVDSFLPPLQDYVDTPQKKGWFR